MTDAVLTYEGVEAAGPAIELTDETFAIYDFDDLSETAILSLFHLAPESGQDPIPSVATRYR